eukprot:IDg22052t1
MASILHSMNVLLDDKELALAAIIRLPPSYGTIITALDAIGDEDESFAFDKVCSRLVQKEKRRSLRITDHRLSFNKLQTLAKQIRSSVLILDVQITLSRTVGKIMDGLWQDHAEFQVPPTTRNLRYQSSSHMKRASFFPSKWMTNQRQQLLEDETTVIATGARTESFYALEAPSTEAISAACAASLQLWHKRMGHVNHNGIQQMSRKGIV